MAVDFSDARLKLTRAREHVAELERRVASYLRSDFYRLHFQPDQQDEGRILIFFDSLHQPDKSINTVVGDAIGNLRSVLDYVAVVLVQPITGKSESISFPFADDVPGFAGEVRKGHLSACTTTIQDHFVNEVQAYNGGKGHAFWALNKLRNIDKHRFLITVAQLAGLRMSWRVGSNIFRNCETAVMAGQSGWFIDGPADIEITDQPKPTFEVWLQEPPIVRDTPVVSFLHGIADHTERFLNTLEIVV